MENPGRATHFVDGVSFVALDDLAFAAERPRAAFVHCQPNAMAHMPSGAQGDAKNAVQLVSADPLFAPAHKNDRLQPHVHRHMAGLKDGPDLDGEGLATRVALVDADTSAIALQQAAIADNAAMRAYDRSARSAPQRTHKRRRFRYEGGARRKSSDASSNGPETPPTPPSLIPAHFPLAPIDEATIYVEDTTITITNGSAVPFCTVSTTPCPDVFSGFGFVFFGDVDITSVTVDPASMFSPIAGGLTFGATDIFLNLVGEAPSAGAALILDVTTGGTTTTPEPASVALLASGLVGLLAMKRRAKRGADAAGSAL
jgi:hypothetical protein